MLSNNCFEKTFRAIIKFEKSLRNLVNIEFLSCQFEENPVTIIPPVPDEPFSEENFLEKFSKRKV